MNTIDLVGLGKSFMERFDKPTLLYAGDDHSVYWLGMPEDTAFRCNSYLVVDGREGVIIDPGGKDAFEFVHSRVEQVISHEQIVAMVLCHQDPDVAGSMADWLAINPGMKVMATGRTNILLPHYGSSDYAFFNVSEESGYYFSSGRMLRFIESPFMHSPGAFTTLDETSGFLFSGDIWAAVDMEWHLVVDDFHRHELKMNLFHLDYMSSNIAARGYADRISGIPVKAILPQHGSIIPEKFIGQAIAYLTRLKCGTDLIYPDLRQK